MRKEKHEEILKEVLEEIESALQDKRGLLSHQRRLAFSLSLGAVNLLELYFHNMDIMKEGSKINHQWFKKKAEKIFDHLQNQITSPINNVTNITAIVDIISEIEEKRDDLAYGPPSNEELLQKKINKFFELKRLLKC